MGSVGTLSHGCSDGFRAGLSNAAVLDDLVCEAGLGFTFEFPQRWHHIFGLFHDIISKFRLILSKKYLMALLTRQNFGTKNCTESLVISHLSWPRTSCKSEAAAGGDKHLHL